MDGNGGDNDENDDDNNSNNKNNNNNHVDGNFAIHTYGHGLLNIGNRNVLSSDQMAQNISKSVKR